MTCSSAWDDTADAEHQPGRSSSESGRFNSESRHQCFCGQEAAQLGSGNAAGKLTSQHRLGRQMPGSALQDVVPALQYVMGYLLSALSGTSDISRWPVAMSRMQPATRWVSNVSAFSLFFIVLGRRTSHLGSQHVCKGEQEQL